VGSATALTESPTTAVMTNDSATDRIASSITVSPNRRAAVVLAADAGSPKATGTGSPKLNVANPPQVVGASSPPEGEYLSAREYEEEDPVVRPLGAGSSNHLKKPLSNRPEKDRYDAGGEPSDDESERKSGDNSNEPYGDPNRGRDDNNEGERTYDDAGTPSDSDHGSGDSSDDSTAGDDRDDPIDPDRGDRNNPDSHHIASNDTEGLNLSTNDLSAF